MKEWKQDITSTSIHRCSICGREFYCVGSTCEKCNLCPDCCNACSSCHAKKKCKYI